MTESLSNRTRAIQFLRPGPAISPSLSFQAFQFCTGQFSTQTEKFGDVLSQLLSILSALYSSYSIPWSNWKHAVSSPCLVCLSSIRLRFRDPPGPLEHFPLCLGCSTGSLYINHQKFIQQRGPLSLHWATSRTSLLFNRTAISILSSVGQLLKQKLSSRASSILSWTRLQSLLARISPHSCSFRFR